MGARPRARLRARPRVRALARALAALLAVVLAATAVTGTAAPARADDRPPVPRDLPTGGPPALHHPERRLPPARGWPLADAFPRTSGTGRLHGGGLYWTDFLYDDHGTTTTGVGNPSVTAGSPSFGTYSYPPGPASGNGADVFRAAVALRPRATVWRVDFTTLADPAVPLAVWTFDRDGDAATGASAWPAGARVRSPGIDTALVVSARGARLVDVASGRVLHRARVAVTRGSGSFVTRLPWRVLPARGAWTVRLATGLADATGAALRSPPRTLPGQPRVYNVTFRRRTQEPQRFSFWSDLAQTRALATGDVSAFGVTVRWRDLARRRATPEARPRGWSTRWYVSRVAPGDGVRVALSTITDRQPNYLGRVQPYSVYVPRSYRPDRPAPLTLLLHSLTQNHHQYAATTPRFTRLACEERRSICLTPLGRGPDGYYSGLAQLDLWEAWRSAASAYRLDPRRTVVSGYSMGGLGSHSVAAAHPDLFARVVTMAGMPGDVPSLVNLRWLPTYIAGGAADELQPVTQQRAEAEALTRLGYRFRWLLIPTIDHVAYELADSFADAARFMGRSRVVRNPRSFTYRWFPSTSASDGDVAWTFAPRLGLRTTGAYWVRGLRAGERRTPARVQATSSRLPGARVEPVLRRAPYIAADPAPGVTTTQTWRTTALVAPRGRTIRLRLSNVRSLSVLLDRAGFRAGRSGVLRVRTDRPVQVRLGDRVVRVPRGRHAVRF